MPIFLEPQQTQLLLAQNKLRRIFSQRNIAKNYAETILSLVLAKVWNEWSERLSSLGGDFGLFSQALEKNRKNPSLKMCFLHIRKGSLRTELTTASDFTWRRGELLCFFQSLPWAAAKCQAVTHQTPELEVKKKKNTYHCTLWAFCQPRFINSLFVLLFLCNKVLFSSVSFLSDIYCNIHLCTHIQGVGICIAKQIKLLHSVAWWTPHSHTHSTSLFFFSCPRWALLLGLAPVPMLHQSMLHQSCNASLNLLKRV